MEPGNGGQAYQGPVSSVLAALFQKCEQSNKNCYSEKMRRKYIQNVPGEKPIPRRTGIVHALSNLHPVGIQCEEF